MQTFKQCSRQFASLMEIELQSRRRQLFKSHISYVFLRYLIILQIIAKKTLECKREKVFINGHRGLI